MEKKLTDKEIIKALECCGSGHAHDSCDQCPLHNVKGCYDTVLNDYALGLIQRLQSENAEQKAEIERLTEELAEEKKLYFDMQDVAVSRYMENCQLIKQRNELQKQVDVLNCEINGFANELQDLDDELELQKDLYNRAREDGYCTGYKSAVKDTAEKFAERVKTECFDGGIDGKRVAVSFSRLDEIRKEITEGGNSPSK